MNWDEFRGEVLKRKQRFHLEKQARMRDLGMDFDHPQLKEMEWVLSCLQKIEITQKSDGFDISAKELELAKTFYNYLEFYSKKNGINSEGLEWSKLEKPKQAAFVEAMRDSLEWSKKWGEK